MLPAAIFAIVFVPMLVEAAGPLSTSGSCAAGAERKATSCGYEIAYPLAFLFPIGEAWLRGRGPSATAAAGGIVFLAAKALEELSRTQGPVAFRVLVPPSSRPIVGPYRDPAPSQLRSRRGVIGVAPMAWPRERRSRSSASPA
jgi:hypothetical protein